MSALHALERCPRWVGNDVVDLAEADEPPPHPRFVARVLSSREQADLADHRPPGGVWGYFAAKEAAYKLFVKALGRPVPFEHRRFEWNAALSRLDSPYGSCSLRVDVRRQRAHAVAWSYGALPPRAVAARRGSSDEGAAVRRLAVQLAARSLGVARSRLCVRRLTSSHAWDGAEPPQLLLAGRPTLIDVSLSHHGRFVAAAVASVEPEVRS